LKTDFSSVDFFFLLRKDALWNKNIEQFLNSLLSFDAELLPHFVFIFKGFTRKEIRQLQERFNIKKNRFIIKDDLGFDLDAYYFATLHTRKRFLFFLNSYSILRCNNAISLLVSHALLSQSRFVGASGSHEAIGYRQPYLDCTSIRSVLFFLLKVLHRTFYAIFSGFGFDNFPNPHIRTNAFFVERSLWLEYFSNLSLPLSKKQCLMIESGESSFTKFAKEESANPGVINSDGFFYNLNELKISDVFRSMNDTKNLIDDNRTLEFQKSSMDKKRSLSWDAWGGGD
jgi:hypothetical protein